MFASSLRRWFGFESNLVRRMELRRRFRPRLQHLEGRIAPAVFPVTNADDVGAGSLRDAITQANADADVDVILFGALFNTPQTISLQSALPVVANPVTIAGPGAGLLTVRRDSMAANFRIFTLDASAATLSGMTITGGRATGESTGGGVRVGVNGSVTIQDSVITGNSADSGGGGIAIVNIVTVNGPTEGSLTVRNSTISGNSAGTGGGIYALRDSNLMVENSTVSGNTASGPGGGVYFFTSGPGTVNWTVRNTTISGNTAGTNGGGVMMFNLFSGSGGALLIQNSTIANNAANGPVTGQGGGIHRTGAGLVSIESTIIANNPVAQAPDLVGTVSAIRSLIRNQTGSVIGGGDNLPPDTNPLLGLLANNGGATQTLVLLPGSPAINAGTNPAGLTTDQRGAGFPRVAGTAVDMGAYERSPPTASGTFGNLTTAGGTSSTLTVAYTDAIAVDVSTLDSTDIRVTGPSGFSALATFVGVDTNINGTPRMATYRITAPGGAFDAADNGTYTVSVEPNQVFNTNGLDVPAGSLGSFQVLLPETFTVANANDLGAGSLRDAITRANANAVADFIVFGSFFSTAQTITLISGELLITNPLTITGTGASQLTVTRSAAAANFRVVQVNGPGVIAVTISGLTISGGRTTGAAGAGTAGDGAGLLMFNDSVTLDGVVVSGNVSGTEGGGIAMARLSGGGAGILMVRNSTLSGNSANGPGAFKGGGGAIYFGDGGTLLLENSTVSGNMSNTGRGGGLYFYGSTGSTNLTIRNSTVSGNSAAGHGGGVLFYTFGANPNHSLTVQNSTVAGNSAGTGGGIARLFTVGTLTLESTILAQNTAASGPDMSGAAMANFSLIGNTAGATITGANNKLNVSANLGTLTNNGGATQTIALLSGSPAINAGSNPANLTTDQRGTGFARAAGQTDIGAFEVQSAVAPGVQSVMVNDGSAQRSRVTSLTITFDAAVNFLGAVADAFTLMRTGGGTVFFSATSAIVGGVTVVTLNNFTGGETSFGSLRDGRYTLTALANQVSAGGTSMAANFSFGDGQGLFRLFGDFNGNRQVDNVDFFFFRPALGSSFPAANYVAGFDFDGDGMITNTDYFQFRNRLGTFLP